MGFPGPLIYGDPIDPNEQYSEVPYTPIEFGYPAAAPAAYRSPIAERPGEAVIAAALSLVTAGLLLITGFVVIFAAGSLQNTDDPTSTSHATLFVFAGLTNVVTAALLIIGGVLTLGRSAAGRGPLALGTLLCMALGVFWLANDQGDSGVLVWIIIFCVPSAAATILTTTARVTDWLRGAGAPA